MAQSNPQIFLIGTQDSPKTNRWEAMTNSWLEVERLKAELGETATHKAIQVHPPRGKRA